MTTTVSGQLESMSLTLKRNPNKPGRTPAVNISEPALPKLPNLCHFDRSAAQWRNPCIGSPPPATDQVPRGFSLGLHS